MSQPKTASLDWYTARELARRWGVSVNTVYRQLHERATPDEPVPAGKLPAIRVGGAVRVHTSAVEHFERSGMPPGPPVESKPRARRALAGAVKDFFADVR